MIKRILSEIDELNQLDGKVLLERFLKFNEEFGELSAEVCKFIGITHKQYDKDHLIEEMADAMQNMFSVYLDICKSTNIEMNDVFNTIIEKNKKWREKAPKYIRNIIQLTNKS